ncbi:Activating signal cointegrator 1 complex subunit 2 [Bagarius yarrelli]|uniref:Activating signal cointegrator 1 complex subunit 2 n=1 Tax=Bagarius yarrelli TaxID=175774 RepID=A0A556VX01_BAGYA|nr:Activating signal cointegrator 1 complex subunit 2 [Bagarius yarrelli]
MATHKESKENFLTPAVFGEIIYDNFLFDIPKILDLCVLFGRGNSQLLRKMIENIFTQQPGYYGDLDQTLPSIIQDLSELVFYLCDTCITLQCFLDIFPEACRTFHKHGFLNRFLADYDEVYPVAEDISLLQQAFPHLDDTRTSYLLHGVESAWESAGKKRPHTLSANHSAETSSRADGDIRSSQSTLDEKGAGLSGEECINNIPDKGTNRAVCSVSAGELESLLSHIRDLLPDFGEGFLMSCLETYGYDSEVVINNILEERLTPELRNLDRNMPRPVKEAPPTTLSSRSNVFDDDEFDVFSRDKVDMSRVWRGRRYRSYQTVVDEVPIATAQTGNHGNTYPMDDYDDEYDDTYDINQVGANDLDQDDELLSRRAPPPSNVVGGPKGRGQTQETLLDRRRKEANKNRGANHNRRTMADRKRNKGMIPS